MRLLVQTKGAFQLQEPETQQLIRSVGYTVVMKTAFVESRAAAGQLIVMAQVGNAATDVEWREYAKACDGDLHLAIESFKSAFPIDEKDTLPTDPHEAAIVKAQRIANLPPVSPPAPAPAGPVIGATAVGADGRTTKKAKA
jgi:hypothetical protein